MAVGGWEDVANEALKPCATAPRHSCCLPWASGTCRMGCPCLRPGGTASAGRGIGTAWLLAAFLPLSCPAAHGV